MAWNKMPYSFGREQIKANMICTNRAFLFKMKVEEFILAEMCY